MILSSQSGNRELRLFEGAGFIPHPGSDDAIWGGPLKTPALGIPAFACGVRLLAEETAACVMRVYEGAAQERQPIYNAPQARLFQEPADGWTSFDLWSDVVTALELERHAFIWKLKTSVGVEEIYPIDPDYCSVRMVKGEKVIKARVDGVIQDVTANVIHIRSWAPRAGPVGASTVELHRRALHGAMSYDDYRGRYFDNDGTPGIVLEHPGQPSKEQRRDLLDGWMRRHGGGGNKAKPGIIWGGVKLHQPTSTLRDAQAAEISDEIVRDVARMLRIFPVDLLHARVHGHVRSAELVSDLFFRFSLLPRMRRIERAIAVDRDVFPQPRRYPRFDVSEFLRGDIATTAVMIHNLIQVGAITKNEGRAYLGLPPVDGGDVLLETPVGATANALDFPQDQPEPAELEPAPSDTTP